MLPSSFILSIFLTWYTWRRKFSVENACISLLPCVYRTGEYISPGLFCFEQKPKMIAAAHLNHSITLPLTGNWLTIAMLHTYFALVKTTTRNVRIIGMFEWLRPKQNCISFHCNRLFVLFEKYTPVNDFVWSRIVSHSIVRNRLSACTVWKKYTPIPLAITVHYLWWQFLRHGYFEKIHTHPINFTTVRYFWWQFLRHGCKTSLILY